MRSWFKPLVAVGVAGACLAGAAAPAVAEVALYASRPSNFSFSTPTALVPLNGGGATSLTFTFRETRRGWRIITFSAECAVAAVSGSFGAWVDIDILVDGVPVSPTNQSSDAFCSSNGTTGFDGWATQSITVAKRLGRGAHTIEIQARLNGATGGWISDTALVVFD